MATVNYAGTRAARACLFVLLFPLAAAAQSSTPPPTAPGRGPMLVERVKSGFLVAPDVKVTEFNHRASELVGAYAGWLADQTFFVGGGGYWLASRSRDREMAYGGLVVGWFAGGDRRVGFGAKGLVGGGRATLASSLGQFLDIDEDHVRSLVNGVGTAGLVNGNGTAIVFPQAPPNGDGTAIALSQIPTVNVRVRQEFFVAEPEATVLVALTKHLRLTGGVGYRLIGGARNMRKDLQGATGSVALQIGGGS